MEGVPSSHVAGADVFRMALWACKDGMFDRLGLVCLPRVLRVRE